MILVCAFQSNALWKNDDEVEKGPDSPYRKRDAHWPVSDNRRDMLSDHEIDANGDVNVLRFIRNFPKDWTQ